MGSGRPLRDAFAELLDNEGARQAYAADPEGFLASYGHGDLPNDLVAEAIVSFADTAPGAIAEHLAPFVMAHGPVPLDAADPGIDPAAGLDLLATAPSDLASDAADLDEGFETDEAGRVGVEDSEAVLADASDDLDFGTGSPQSPHPPLADHASSARHADDTPSGADAVDVEPASDAPDTPLDGALGLDPQFDELDADETTSGEVPGE